MCHESLIHFYESKVESTRRLVHYHEQFLGLSNHNQRVEDLPRSNMVCTMSSESIRETFKGL